MKANKWLEQVRVKQAWCGICGQNYERSDALRCLEQHITEHHPRAIAILPAEVSPIDQPPAEDLRNAMQILTGRVRGVNRTHRAIELIRSALAKLAEPTGLVIERTRAAVPCPLDDREVRDIAAVLMMAALEGR